MGGARLPALVVLLSGLARASDPWRLFLELDGVREMRGLRREFHVMEKHPGNPLFSTAAGDAERRQRACFNDSYEPFTNRPGTVLPSPTGGWNMWM